MSRTALKAFAVAVVVYVVWLAVAYRYHFLDGVNLLVHEAGHILFMPFGSVMAVAGGTILQLLFPLAFVLYFARQRKAFETGVCGVWAAESLMYTARYLGDAEAQVLPLVGGHLHDWTFLLGRVGLVEQSEQIGRLVHIAASLLAILAAWAVLRSAWAPEAGYARTA